MADFKFPVSLIEQNKLQMLPRPTQFFPGRVRRSGSGLTVRCEVAGDPSALVVP